MENINTDKLKCLITNLQNLERKLLNYNTGVKISILNELYQVKKQCDVLSTDIVKSLLKLKDNDIAYVDIGKGDLLKGMARSHGIYPKSECAIDKYIRLGFISFDGEKELLKYFQGLRDEEFDSYLSELKEKIEKNS